MKKDKLKIKEKVGISIVLKAADFRKLWFVQIFSQLADKFFIVLAVYLITENWSEVNEVSLYTKGEIITILATGVYIANSLPAIFFGAFAGIASDIISKFKILFLSNSLRGFFSILIPISLIKGQSIYGIDFGYLFLLGITFINSFLTQFFTPAEQSSIPLLVRKKNLLAANSLYQATTMFATILGFAFGEPLLRSMRFLFEKIGVNGGDFLLLPICYLTASIILLDVNIKEKEDRKASKNIWLDLKYGINFLKEKVIVRSAILQLIILYSLMAALYVLSIGIASSIPELGPTKFGILLGICGLGIALGAFLIAQKGHLTSKQNLSSTGLVLISLCLVLIGQCQGYLFSNVILCFILGVGASLVAIPAQTTVQENTPPKELGKVFGLQNNLINISLSVPLVIAGGLVSQFGLIAVLWLLAALTFLGAIFKHH